MQIVIDISEEVYKKAKETHDAMCDSVWLGIKYGTPLPKGHGRLIDAEKLLDTFWIYCKQGDFGYHQAEDLIKSAPIIIEADKRDYENDDYYKGAQEEY